MSEAAADEVECVDPLLAALADGQWHAGPGLAARLGVSRSAVSARIGRLRRTGIDIYAVSGKGYRVSAPLDMLSAATIRAELSPPAAARLQQLILLQRVDSTNSELLRRADGATRACAAESQSAGRGRAGRPWVSPFAANLYLSVGAELAAPRAPIATLSLAVGVGLAERLDALGVADIGLKWPNDLWIGTDKVGGILTEARTEAGGGARVIVGLGLNVAMPRAEGAGIDQPWTRLADHLPVAVGRSRLAGVCLDAILSTLARFEQEGFTPFAARWPDYDRLHGRAVVAYEGSGQRTGTVCGLGTDGSLILDCEDGRRPVYAGDVRLRLAPQT